MASFLLSRKIALERAEKRLIDVSPGIQVSCDCYWQSERQNAMTLIVVHGLEGSSESQYMLGMANKGTADGMNVVLMNQRNCGGTESLAPTLYHSGLSDDVAAVARNLIANDHISSFALVGFSMGGNLVLKLAGEWGKNGPPEFKGVAGVCPAIDLAPSADALHFPSNRLYEWYFMWKMRKRLREKAKLFPDTYDVSRLRGVRTLRQFDDKITAFYCGFDGATDYYARAAASNVIANISVPALILHAANDPFIRLLPETRAKILANPHITFAETEDGGHCSYIGNSDGYDGYWAEREVIKFAQQLQ